MLKTLRCGFITACLLVFVVSLLVRSTIGQENKTLAPQDIVCKIYSRNKVWQQSKQALVEIELTNIAKTSFDLKIVPSLILRPIDSSEGIRGGYWSPVDIIENHALRTRQEIVAEKGLAAIMAQPIHLHREAGTTIRYEVDAVSTKWEKQISSLWPEGTLYNTVPSGKYILSLEMESKEYGRANISCGEAIIEIATNSKK